MKILFLFGAIPHYLVPVLNKLQDFFDIYVLLTEKKSSTIGKGVKIVNDGFKFNVLYTEEVITYYKKPFYKNFYQIVKSINPDIIVFGWPYILSIVFYPNLLIKLKFKKIKLVFRDIPFQVPKFYEAINPFSKRIMITEDGEKIPLTGLKKLNDIFLAFVRLFFANIVDMHLYYASVGFDIYKTYFVSRKKMFLLSNSPDTNKLLLIYDELKDTNKPEKNTIIHVGRLIKWKKVDLLLKSVAIVKNQIPDIKLKIIGDGPELDNLKRLVNELKLENNVTFLGAIYESKELGKHLMTSQIYVIAGMGGLSINEAMCFGKPVICSVCDGTEKDLVFDDYNGKYFIEDDEKDLAQKIYDLLSNPAKIIEFGKNSQKIIREKININLLIENYIKAFNLL